jgi:hypothetical protein
MWAITGMVTIMGMTTSMTTGTSMDRSFRRCSSGSAPSKPS